MKLRRSFVTNSSSSCFIVNRNKWEEPINIEQAKEIVQILLEAHNKINNTNIDMNKICKFTDSKDEDIIEKLFREQCWSGNESIGYCDACEYCEHEYKDCSYDICPIKEQAFKTYTQAVQEGVLAIFCGENEMPYELFGSINTYLGATRYHLG